MTVIIMLIIGVNTGYLGTKVTIVNDVFAYKSVEDCLEDKPRLIKSVKEQKFDRVSAFCYEREVK